MHPKLWLWVWIVSWYATSGVYADWLVEVSGVTRPGVYLLKRGQPEAEIIRQAGGARSGQRPQLIKVSSTFTAQAQAPMVTQAVSEAPKFDRPSLPLKLYSSPVRWQPEIDQRYAQAVEQGMNYWNNQFSSLGLPGIALVRVNNVEDAQVVLNFEELPPGTAGLANPSEGYIKIDRSADYFRKRATLSRNYTFIYFTVVHELGHMLGLDHTREAGTIMYYLNDLESRPTGLSEVSSAEVNSVLVLGNESTATLRRLYANRP